MSALHIDQLRSLDCDLAAIARATNALRLHLGQALEILSARGWHHELGFSSLEAYAYERCQRSGRWAADSRVMARRLAVLPELGHRLLEGELGWSMVELLARHATPQTEKALAVQASCSTVRQMRAHLGAAATPESDEAEFRTITATVDREETWIFDCTRLLVEQVEGQSNVDRMLHTLLAEATSALVELLPVGTLAAYGLCDRNSVQSVGGEARRGAEPGGVRDEANLSHAPGRCPSSAAALQGSLVVHRPATSSSELDAGTSPVTPDALDGHVRELATELARRDLAIGTLANGLVQAGGIRLLGYVNEAAYARERLGLSLSSLKARRALAVSIQRLPGVGMAVEQGRIGYVAATLVARIATRRTLGAWLERATQRTVKHLREEVEAAELLVRLENRRAQRPPDEELMRALAEARRFGMERLAEIALGRGSKPSIRPGGLKPASQMSGGCAENDPSSMRASAITVLSKPDAAGGSNGTFGRVTLRFRVTADTFEFWKALERCFLKHRDSLSPEPVSFLHFLCVCFWRSWGSVVVQKGAWAHIFARDGFRCLSPVCARRDAQAHHLEFRSHGGGDHDENLGSLCTWCHLLGVHEGRIVARPPASRIRWSIGRSRTLNVHGRCKLAA